MAAFAKSFAVVWEHFGGTLGTNVEIHVGVSRVWCMNKTRVRSYRSERKVGVRARANRCMARGKVDFNGRDGAAFFVSLS
jgi:hypothetical protein